jgi:hypothetical protein
MFSEVYWHHAVRSATAMFQRAFYALQDSVDLGALLQMTDQPMIDALLSAAAGMPAATLVEGLFGPRRQVYKRLAQYSYFEQPAMYGRLARRPYAELVGVAERIAETLSTAIKRPIAAHEVLVDAPPTELSHARSGTVR